MAILVTGGAGYIGSHTCVELLDADYEVVVLDNLSNSSEKSLDRVRALTGKEVKFYKGDILDRDVLKKILETENIESCIHFAGLKAVGESVAKPWEYYNNNITGTLTLVDEMRKHGCKNIIFFVFCNCLRRSGDHSDYRRMPQRNLYQSVWLVEIHAGADFKRYAESGSGMERYPASLFQSDRSA